MSRYYCLDESGTIKFPFNKEKDFCFLLALLEIRDQKSKYKVAKAVRKTLQDFQKHLEVCHAWPREIKIPELKSYDPYHRNLSQNNSENAKLKPKLYERGRRKRELIIPGLSSHLDVERCFFYRIAKAENLSIYIAYLDKRALKTEPPTEYDRRYALLLRHFLSSIKHPPKKNTIIIDKRHVAKDQKEALEEEISRRMQKGKGRKSEEQVKAELEKNGTPDSMG